MDEQGRGNSEGPEFASGLQFTFTLNGYAGKGSLETLIAIPGLIHDGTLTFSGTPTPEPNSLILLFSGAGILAGLLRRRIGM